MKNISVIIPVYNGSKYIIRCLDSLIEQTCKEFEVIIVNDGSTDDSLQLIQNYKEKHLGDLNICIYNQKNSGIAVSRNNGIAYSDKEYIVFLDQDDYVEKDYIEILSKEIKKGNLDIVVTGYNRVTFDGRIKRRVSIINDEWGKFLNVAPWGKIYKTSFIVENNLHFLKVIKGEDVYFTINAYSLTNKITTLPYVGYNWVDNDLSVSNTLHREIKIENSIMPLFYELSKTLQGQKCITSEILEYFFIKSTVYELLYCARGKEKEDILELYKKVMEWLDKNFPENIQNKYVSFFCPKSEMWYTRIIIKFFWTLRKFRLAKKFLIIYAALF